MMTTDVELLEAWRAGDKRAGKRLFERHYDAVHRFFRNKVGSDAPDLVQKTFLGCIESVDRFRGEGSFRSWLFAVAYRQLCKHYRSKSSERARFDVGMISAADLDPTPSRMSKRCRCRSRTSSRSTACTSGSRRTRWSRATSTRSC